eukprot:scaffold7.g3654.t1
MPWLLLVWLLAFMLQMGVLGTCMYALIQYSDLENDLLNPHDAAANVNKLVLPEYAGQAVLAVLLLGSGRWVLGLAQAAMLLYHARLYVQRRHLVDVTEIFREVGKRKRAQMVKLFFYIVSFCWTIYQLIEITISALLSPSGRQAARDLLQEAAAAMHRRRR